MSGEVLSTGVDMATVTVQPSGMDAVFSSLGSAAQALVGAYTNAEVRRIEGVDPVSLQSQPQRSGSSLLVMGGIGIAVLLIAIMAMRAR